MVCTNCDCNCWTTGTISTGYPAKDTIKAVSPQELSSIKDRPLAPAADELIKFLNKELTTRVENSAFDPLAVDEIVVTLPKTVTVTVNNAPLVLSLDGKDTCNSILQLVCAAFDDSGWECGWKVKQVNDETQVDLVLR